MNIQKATLSDGRIIDYLCEDPKEGAMKEVYFTPDKKSVVCFFKDTSDVTRQARLEAVLGKFNPTTDPKDGDYYRKLFCWPTAIVVKPKLGIVCPTYPANFWFKSGPWSGNEKVGYWFTGQTGGGRPFRDMMPPEERGEWINFFPICIQMARAVWRLHAKGLAHSDLSPRNILIDPRSGTCVIIDIDSLVVPGIFPPDVDGTKGYIAPEVIATMHLSKEDRNRKFARTETDLHALAVLIYRYLFYRHPLEGPKVNSPDSTEEDDRLSMGSKALFIEHPTNQSNRPKDLKIPHDVLGTHLSALFRRAFVDGLHQPEKRPIALDWLKALIKTSDLMHRCANAACTHKWFVRQDAKTLACPYCKTRASSPLIKLQLTREANAGLWSPNGEITIYNGKNLHKWHALDNFNVYGPVSDVDKVPVADCQLYNGKWILINRGLNSMKSVSGAPVPKNSAVELVHGAKFRLADEQHGQMAQVEIFN